MSSTTAHDRVEAFYRERYFGTWGGRNILAGSMPGPDAVLVHSNDYLDIARHPEIVDAQIRSLRAAGNGVLMSAALLQRDAPQHVLEDRFAAHLGADRAVLCQSGWAANVGLLQTIAGPGDAVYVDQQAHMSLWEGARTAGAQVRGFRHNRPEHLLARIRAHGPGIVLVDSVYSTDGSVCPLAEVAAVAAEHGCPLVVDESHSLGTHGPRGSGLVDQLGLTGSVDFVTASLSKAFVGRAGLITCPTNFVEYFRLTSLPAVFSSALLPHDIAGLVATLAVVRAADRRRLRLAELSARVREGLSAGGIDLGGSASQIVSLPAGDERTAAQLRDAYEKLGIYGSLFIPPATNPGRALIRLSLHAGLTDDRVERIIAGCLTLAAR